MYSFDALVVEGVLGTDKILHNFSFLSCPDMDMDIGRAGYCAGQILSEPFPRPNVKIILWPRGTAYSSEKWVLAASFSWKMQFDNGLPVVYSTSCFHPGMEEKKTQLQKEHLKH